MALYTTGEILKDAQEKGYGVGFFDVFNMEMVRAVIDAAEACRAPVLIGSAESLLPYSPSDWIMPMMLEQARRARVPVAVHMDHTYRFELLMRALRAGCSSVMYDGSRLPDHKENVRRSAEIVRIAHAMGASVECELGSVGGLSDEAGNVDQTAYTEPGDALDFVERTGCDFLAVSIGTQHGVYTSEPKLDIPRLERIRATVDVPLVLHGGSGLSDADFRNVVAGGISKINVYTDVILAARQAIADHVDEPYIELCRHAEAAMREAAMVKIRLFGGANRY